MTGTIRQEIERELASARQKFPPFSSAHEGYAILLEEVDELWEQVKRQYTRRSREDMRKECIQIAAMALRFIEDCLDGPGETKSPTPGRSTG